MACTQNYTIQCRDVRSGAVGCFLFDTAHWQLTGEFAAIGPVFSNLGAFFAWDNANGKKRKNIYLERA